MIGLHNISLIIHFVENTKSKVTYSEKIRN